MKIAAAIMSLMLPDMSDIKPEAFSQEIRAIEAMQQPFYRSGFVVEKTAEFLRKSTSQITPKQIKALK